MLCGPRFALGMVSFHAPFQAGFAGFMPLSDRHTPPPTETETYLQSAFTYSATAHFVFARRPCKYPTLERKASEAAGRVQL